VIAHSVYASTVGCAITYSLVLASDGTTLATSPWLQVDSSGQVTVDVNTLGSEQIKVKMNYNGADHLTSAFTVSVGCSAITTNTITATNTYDAVASNS